MRWLNGTLWVLGIAAIACFVVAITAYDIHFLWACLVLEMLILPFWAVRCSLKKGGE